MQTDRLFYELFQLAPGALFELFQLNPACVYRFESLTVKSIERRMDGLLEPAEPEQPHFFLEIQGYEDPSIYWRAIQGIGLYHEKRPNLNGKNWRAIFLFLDPSFDPGPQTLGPLYSGENSWLIRGTLRDLLSKVSKPSPVLNVLRPLITQDEMTIRQEAVAWTKEIRQSPLDEPTKKHLLLLLIQFIGQRFIHLPRKEIEKMLKLTPFEETVAGREYMQEGMQIATQASILEVLETRFVAIPKEIRSAIEQIQDISVLKLLLRQAVVVESLDKFEQVIAKHA